MDDLLEWSRPIDEVQCFFQERSPVDRMQQILRQASDKLDAQLEGGLQQKLG
jgi:hypothetical protein